MNRANARTRILSVIQEIGIERHRYEQTGNAHIRKAEGDKVQNRKLSYGPLQDLAVAASGPTQGVRK